MQRFQKLRRINSLSFAFGTMTFLSVVIFAVVMFLFLTKRGVTKDNVEVASYAATAVGFGLVAAGVFLASAVLQQSHRGNDLRITAARRWLEKRQQIVAEIEYAMFASPTLLSNLIVSDPSKISRSEAIRCAVSVFGSFRRLRDSLSGFASDRGFLLTHAVMQEPARLETSDSFKVYMNAYSQPRGYVPTEHLLRSYSWLFVSSEDEKGVPLSPQVMLEAYTQAMVELDYLDQRIPSLLDTLIIEDERASNLVETGSDNSGAVLHEALVTAATNIYCHLAVMRAFLEVEWVAIFPKVVKSHQLEDRISRLLMAGDEAAFVARAGGSRGVSIPDNVAGFRFAHALAQAGLHGAFVDNLDLNEPSPEVGPPSRIWSLYGGWYELYLKNKAARKH